MDDDGKVFCREGERWVFAGGSIGCMVKTSVIPDDALALEGSRLEFVGAVLAADLPYSTTIGMVIFAASRPVVDQYPIASLVDGVPFDRRLLAKGCRLPLSAEAMPQDRVSVGVVQPWHGRPRVLVVRCDRYAVVLSQRLLDDGEPSYDLFAPGWLEPATGRGGVQ